MNWKSDSSVRKLVADGLYKEALHLFSHLHSSSHTPHFFTFPSLLKACANLSSPSFSPQILHSHILKTGFLSHPHTSTALTAAYVAAPRSIHDALKLFDEMPQPTITSFNAALSGLSRNGPREQALGLFRRVGLRILRPNSVTVASLLTACDTNPCHVAQVHGCALKLGVESDVYTATSLVTAYSKCGVLVSASKVFVNLHVRNVVSYNAFMSGLLQNGYPRLVCHVFKDMVTSLENRPNSVTLVCVLSACATLLYIRLGRQVHGVSVKLEACDHVIVVTALVDMYSKCGYWSSAFDVFSGRKNWNLITCNSMIAGMMMNSQSEKAVDVFQRMEGEGVLPDSATWNSLISGFAQQGMCVEAFKYFKKMQCVAAAVPCLKIITSLLSACAVSSVLGSGKEIHGYAVRNCVDKDEFFATGLVDMYMKCGHVSWARKVFDHFDAKPDDPAFWNAMIGGYGRNGDYESAFEIFDEMLAEMVQPNSVTFVSVLSACSHGGQVERGLQVFRMIREYDLEPKPGHFGCVVDLLGRAGRLREARDLIQELAEPPASVFASLLGACKCYLDSNLGEEMAMKLLDIEPENPAPLVDLSNIYAGLGKWREVERIRGLITDKGLDKLTGVSTIEVA